MAKIPQNLESTGDTKSMQFLQYITSGVVLVLFVGFIAMIVAYLTVLLDVQNYKQSYIDLSNKITQQQQIINQCNLELEKNGADLTKIKKYFGIK